MDYATAKLAEEKVFKDPVHSYVHVRDLVIWDLVGTAEFQRLRRIRQLGTTYLVFHGAEHSRFNHSLGVYEIVRRIVDDIFKGRPEWDESERLVALCAALLHDLGHGPFSHAFENVFATDHEQFTRAILLGNTEVNVVLSRVAPDFPEKVAQVIEKTYPNKQVVSLISSQIDADRMDYLQRDAYYTGVSYGHFDMERILRVMRPRKDSIVIKKSGMHAVEHYIMSRYQMYLQIYFHPVSRSGEVVLNNILKRAKALYCDGYQFKHAPTHFIPFFEERVTLADYISLDESVMMVYFQFWTQEEDAILRDMAYRFMNRKLFKYATFNPNEQPEIYEQLKALCLEAGFDPNYYLVVDKTSDLPYDSYLQSVHSSKMPIFIELDGGQVRELSEQSLIVEAIAGKMKTDYKVYFPTQLLHHEQVGERFKKMLEKL